jgi:hypothetical protein
LKPIEELANLHDMYMPSKIPPKNAQILLENHKCETCEDVFAVFKPYKVTSNAEHQHSINKIRENVLSIIRTVVHSLIIRSPTKRYHINNIGPKKK